MIHAIRRRCVLAGLVGLLALPLPATTVAWQLSASDALPRATRTKQDPEEHKQTALAAYIASTYQKPFDYAHAIVRTTFGIAKQYSLPHNLLLAMMEKESAFNVEARNASGATGLMQVMPNLHRNRLEAGETVHSLKKPETNIRVAADILHDYLTQEGSLERALRKYSGNSSGYAQRVNKNWRRLEAVERTPAG
jgi:soluble lytic murein transglycosylase-like protein